MGVIGTPEAAKYCYLGLYALQHRGQEGAGIVSTDGVQMFPQRAMGLVADVFDAETLQSLKGNAAIGHTRYATAGSKDWQNLQPLLASFREKSFSVAHNGNLVNAEEVRRELENQGAIFSTSSDTEVILHLVARERSQGDFVSKVAAALRQVKGAYSLAILGYDRLLAVRDPAGVRPLSLGRIGDGYILASETCAFDLIGATFVRDIEPGEILEISSDGKMRSDYSLQTGSHAYCIFEHIYFSRPDSTFDGRNVYAMRKRLGAELAREHPVRADIIVPVPDSGVPAAMGYAQEAGIPLEFGLIRNHYVGRTFIEPSQSIRDFGVKVKLNPNRDLLVGKRVVVVDDSIVRGTTCRKIVGMLRSAGAKEIHLRVSSPPTTGPCHYGIDTPSKEELVAATHTVEETRKFIDADSLGYLSTQGMYRAVSGNPAKFCDACFTGNYRLGEVTPTSSNIVTLSSKSPQNRGGKTKGSAESLF